MKKNVTIISVRTFCCIFLSTFFFQSKPGLAQLAPAKIWDRAFGGNGSDYLYALKPTADGGAIAAGYSNSGLTGTKSQASKGGNDFWVVKLDANGMKQWDKTLGGSGEDLAYAVQQTSDGGYIVGGHSNSPVGGDKSQASRGQQDYWLVKLDANGNKLWDKTYGGSDNDYGRDVQLTSDGGYIIGGYSRSSLGGDKTEVNKGITGFQDYWVVKLDASGNKQWDKTIGGTHDDFFNAVKQTSDGGYILGGYSSSDIGGDKTSTNHSPANEADYWIVKLNASGVKVWDKGYGGWGTDILTALHQTSDGGYILCGGSDSGLTNDKTQAGHGDYDFWILKLDVNGNKTWDKTFGGSNGDVAYAMHQTSDGGYLVGGRSTSNNTGDKTILSRGDNDYWLIKLSSAGVLTWQTGFGGAENDYLRSIEQAPDGNYWLGGYSGSGIFGDKSQANSGPFGTTDFWIIKLAHNATRLPELASTSELTISPNPNKGSFLLQINNIKTSEPLEFTISNMMGQTILRKRIPVRSSQFSEQIELPGTRGLYLIQVKINGKLVTRKILVE